MHAHIQDTIVFFKECVTEKKKVLNNIRLGRCPISLLCHR